MIKLVMIAVIIWGCYGDDCENISNDGDCGGHDGDDDRDDGHGNDDNDKIGDDSSDDGDDIWDAVVVVVVRMTLG